MTAPELAVPPTERDGHGAGDGASPTPAPPFTAEEWDSINAAIWSDLDDDRHRIADLLAIALGTLAGIALDETADPFPGQPLALCVRTLREMEQRALWGPEQEDHR